MVPKRMDASCLALPPPGGWSSESSSEASESTTDQSSSSGRTREERLWVWSGGKVEDWLLLLSCWGRRWNGFVSVGGPGGVC